MEEKKFDLNSLIGFVLLGALMMFWVYNNKPTPEELEKQRTEFVQDSIQKAQQLTSPKKVEESSITPIVPNDSIAAINAQNALGAFAYSTTLPSATAKETTIENDLLKITISNKGGQISEVELKNFKTYDQKPLYLIKDQNASFNINFGTNDNRILNTKDLFFEPTLTSKGENQILSMKLKVDANRFLEYYYEIKPNDYMIDFSIRSQGLNNVINSSQSLNLDWQLDAYRNEKSLYAENMYTWYY